MTNEELVEQLYPGCIVNGSFNPPTSYTPIIDALGTVAIRADDDYVQGDSRILYRESNGKWGYLLFGWGSCSVCDALQACESYAELNQLFCTLQAKIIWFDTAQDAQEFVVSHDWENEPTSLEDNRQLEFRQSCMRLLGIRDVSYVI